MYVRNIVLILFGDNVRAIDCKIFSINFQYGKSVQ